jgi:hypothetical protein
MVELNFSVFLQFCTIREQNFSLDFDIANTYPQRPDSGAVFPTHVIFET